MAKLTDRFKKNKEEEDGFDIVNDIKEPFSLSNFFETQVIDRARRFREVLADKGILFFLTSPFQARSRLVAQMAVLCIGILFGVIPRTSSMITETQNKAYTSEIANLKEKNVGSLTIIPGASSYYKRVHMLAFVIEGKTLPSTASGYEVYMGSSYGASDWSDVTYSWNVLPVDDEKRILLVGIDQTNQASGYGAFELSIQLAGEELEDYEKDPYEIVISTAQETGKLYDKNGIHLSALSEAVCGTGEIAAKQEAFEAALSEYRIALEQTEAMPIDLTVSPTAEELEAKCLTNRLYRSLTDTSTTSDITGLEPVDAITEFEVPTVLTSEGIEYGSEFINEISDSGFMSDQDTVLFNAFTTVDNAKTSVISAMNSVNSAALSWYNKLKECIMVLNQEVTYEMFPYTARCTSVIGDEIEYVKDSGNSTATGSAVEGEMEKTEDMETSETQTGETNAATGTAVTEPSPTPAASPEDVPSETTEPSGY